MTLPADLSVHLDTIGSMQDLSTRGRRAPHRSLELSPKYWVRTRVRLDQREIELPLGHETVPSPTVEQEPSPS